MPLYEFKAVGGNTMIERFYPAGDVPELGEVIDVGGKKFMRVISSGIQIDSDVKNRVHGYPYVSNALPRDLPGCDSTPEGKPIIRSRKHEKEVAARHGLKRD